MPAVPSFALKLGLGEMAYMILGGNKVVPKNILEQGFNFQYPNLDDALENLLSKS